MQNSVGTGKLMLIPIIGVILGGLSGVLSIYKGFADRAEGLFNSSPLGDWLFLLPAVIYGIVLVIYVVIIIKMKGLSFCRLFFLRAIGLLILSCAAYYAAILTFQTQDSFGLAGFVGAAILFLSVRFLLLKELSLIGVLLLAVAGGLVAFLCGDNMMLLYPAWQGGTALVLGIVLMMSDKKNITTV
jgi:hypothetical protein